MASTGSSQLSLERLAHLLRKKPSPVPPSGPPLPIDEPVDEEVIPGYDSKAFYPAKPGEVLGGRYQLLVKVGWGVSSTVWLARDMHGYCWEPDNIVALKIIINTLTDDEEYKIEQHIATSDPSHPGHALFRTSKDHFRVDGPDGSHLCLAYEPLREPLWLYQMHFKDDIIPLPSVKAYVKAFLAGLDYLHTSCKIAHTDLKLDNFMVTFEDFGILRDFLDSETYEPMPHKMDASGRRVYLCNNDFGPLRRAKNIPMFVDFGSSIKFDSPDERAIHPIQPDSYRAPEVILGCGWGMSVDIWNLGVLLWDLLEGRTLFSQVLDQHGNYDAKAHLAEMIALLGPPPPKLIARYRSMVGYKWSAAVQRDDGKLCESAEQYFDGPFFDADGRFLHEHLIPDRKLEDTLPPLQEKDRENLLSFAKLMLTWLPEDRKSARELIEHPFLQLILE